MGYSSYSADSRSIRASNLDYKSVTTDHVTFKKTFKQQEERKVHESMNSKGLKVRECFDSEAHPNAIPIILGLDVTGSMGNLPKQLLAEDLPKIMSALIQGGVDASLCFTSIGDHEWDNFPLQVGQFESGDLELDTWLTRTYLEGGGGGNDGESYLLAWLFAAFFTKTDAWSKRQEKGYIFTFGDEPCLPNISLNHIKEVFGENCGIEKSYTAEELIALAQEKYHVYHLNIKHDSRTYSCQDLGWSSLLGQNAINTEYDKIVKTIIEIVGKHKPSMKTKTESFETSQVEDQTSALDEITPML